MNQPNEKNEPLDECRVLEEEFEHLHHELGPDYPHEGTADEREQELRKRIYRLAPGEKRSALCLSGGGIRSATFSLGVLQGLARKGLLDKFHYLSTVSGGGYIGSWLSSWIHHKQDLNSVQRDLSVPRKGVSPEPEPIRRLRAYSNYLSPVWGLSVDFLTLVATFLRNLALNWSVFIPLLAAVLMLPRIYLASFGLIPGDKTYVFWSLFGALAFSTMLLVVGIAYIVADLPDDRVQRRNDDKKARNAGKSPPSRKNTKEPVDRFFIACFLPIFSASVLLSWAGICYQKLDDGLYPGWFLGGGALVHVIGNFVGQVWRRKRNVPWQDTANARRDSVFILFSGAIGGALLGLAASYLSESSKTGAPHELYSIVSVPILLGCFWAGAIMYQGLARKITSEDDREWWARSAAWWLGASAVWIAGFALVIHGPRWALNIPWLSDPAGPEILGAGGGILGIVTGLIGYWSKNGARLKQRAKSIAAASGLRLLDLAALTFTIILLLTLSYAVSWGLRKIDSKLESKTQEIVDKSAVSKSEATPKQAVTPEEAARAAAKAMASSSKAAEPAAKGPEVSAALVQPRQKTEQSPLSRAYVHVLYHASMPTTLMLFTALIAVGLLMSFFIGANTFSLHSMYGNRLVRAYLGATRSHREPHWFTGFDPDDNLCMEHLFQYPQRLFHVINIALNLVNPSDGRLEWQQRKAASFIVTPLHAGSASIGYQPVASYSGKNGVSVGRAMAISGAAASPSMGYHTSSLVAFVMTFFNIRLGWWLPNPGPKGREKWTQGEPSWGFVALLAEALGKTTDKSPYVYLSDGGHFENLALYEMVKRRCHRIVLVDAGCDPKYTFEDLESAIRKIRIDMGISIVFPTGLPTPQNAGKSGRHIALGAICYSDVDGPVENGSIVYIKPVMSGDEPLDIVRYCADNNKPESPFPHQSTADQFFDEAQFESYRMLGLHSVLTGFRGNAVWPEEGQNSDKEIDAGPEPAATPGAGGVMRRISGTIMRKDDPETNNK